MAEQEPTSMTWQQGMPKAGAAACGNADASRAALDILEAGGNAIDAAVAAAYVMGTVEPLDSGIGAGGFMIMHDAASGKTEAVDFLGVAPMTARYDLYASMDTDNAYIVRVKGRENERGHRSVAVPGTVRGLGEAQAKFGKLAMADVFLIALYITLTKGIGVGRIEVAWGLYLFTACIFASLWIGLRTEQFAQNAEIVSKNETEDMKLPHFNTPKIK